MRSLAAISMFLLLSACTGDDPLLQEPDDGGTRDAGRSDSSRDSGRDMATRDDGVERDTAPPQDTGQDATQPEDVDRSFTIVLGDGDPFAAWEDGADLPVVAGFQGGYHTEHTVRLDPSLTRSDIADALIEVSLTDASSNQLAGGGWLFDPTQWTTTNEGHDASIPPVVSSDEPVYDTEVELVGSAELTDGRTAEFRVTMTLVPAAQ